MQNIKIQDITCNSSDPGTLYSETKEIFSTVPFPYEWEGKRKNVGFNQSNSDYTIRNNVDQVSFAFVNGIGTQ